MKFLQFFWIQVILLLYSKGDITGVAFDSGDGVTHIVPVCEGYALSHAIQKINITGRDITEQLIRLLLNRVFQWEQQLKKK